MAIAVVNSKEAGSSNQATLSVTSATAGNILVAFVSQTGSTSAPSGNDNKGSTGWITNATDALYLGSTASLWLLTKTAVGGETLLSPTVGSGGTIICISYLELSGASTTIDAIVPTNNGASTTSQTSGAVTTSNAGDIIVGCVTTSGGTGTINAWTGTGPMTNISTASTQCVGAYYIPGAKLTGATFTANWTNARTHGMLVAAIKPAVAAVINSDFFAFM